MEQKDSGAYVKMLLQTLQKQETTLWEVLKVTQRQSEIANGQAFNEDDFGETLNQKEILIARLNSLDDGFASVYSRVRNEVREHKDRYKEELLEIQKCIKICTDLGVEIKVLEERNRDRLAQCFTEKHKQYGSQMNAATVASKYHRTMYSGRMGGSDYTL